MDILTSDDSILTDDSSASNRTFNLEDATFPPHTPVINSEGSNCDAKSTSLARDRKQPFFQFAMKLGHLSLAVASKETPTKNPVFPYSSSSGIPHSPFRQAKKLQPTTNASTFKRAMGRSSTTSAFQRRKIYDDARRKSLHLSTPRRIDPRRQPTSVIPSVAKQREEAATARASIRIASRRALVNRNRPGLDG